MRDFAIASAAVLTLLSLETSAQAPVARDGTIVERTPCAPYSPTTYAQYIETAKQIHAGEIKAAAAEGITMRTPVGYLSEDEFNRATAASMRIECTRIMYMSDGLKVAGLMLRLKDQGTNKLPLMIYNRGGNRDFGRVPEWQTFHRFAAEGFVVLAPQYRGVDGGEGVEQFGGADINDVRSLLPLAESLGFIDTNNVFMLGWSRGAMQTLVAVKQGMRANAIAVGGPLLDLFAEAERRPLLAKFVWSVLMPGFATRRDELLRERSALHWQEKIDTPVLILQGTGDWRVSPMEALQFAQKLQAAGKAYELVMYANDDHGLTVNRTDSNRRIVEWFKKHLRGSQPSASARILEIRVYTLKAGTRDAFHERFVRESLPLLQRRNVDVVAYGPSLDDAVSYYLVRSFESLDQRTRSEDEFYSSREWREGPREAVLAAIETYSTVVVRADPATVSALRRLVPPVTATGVNMPNSAATLASDTATLLALNETYVRSVQLSDVEKFREILADDFLCTLPDGSHLDRNAFLTHVAKPPQISKLEAHDVNVRVMGDFALVHARTTYLRDSDGKPGAGRYTDAWVRRNGRWVAVAAHVTRN